MQRIHTSFDLFTSTGRMVSLNPNLQNVPHPKEVRAEDALVDIQNANLRDAFQASEGMILISADYSQLELRIIAYLAQEKLLLNILNSGGDVFKMIASQWNKVSLDQVTDPMRKKAKIICYGGNRWA